MNWGRSLILVFVLFAAFMAYLVFRASNTHFDLVSKDYYKDELRYQDKINGLQHAAMLSSPVQMQINNQMLNIELPAEMKGKTIQGELWLYCKTDAGKDARIPIHVDSITSFSIQLSGRPPGTYLAKLHWESLQVPYDFEQEITIP
ncbi:MAG: hypothetical protein EBX50_04860 [Chitinophagia bacterium]|nr:hypothetical protein [Chitinophagia bacterium]